LIKIHQTSDRGKILALFLFLLVWGCAADNAARKEPFFEKWENSAKESAGHSPAPRSRSMIITDDKTGGGERTATASEKEAEPVKTLSNELVTLKMRQADVKAVIRALARVSGKNILIKNDVKGEISVDFGNVPWDQAFNSILRTYGLSYVLEGDIIRILSLEDMEQSTKISAVQEKRKVQVMEGKLAEPLVTMMVSVDYADPVALRDNLMDFLTKDKDGKLSHGSIRVDKHNNALIVQAIREDIDRILPIIEKIDKPIPQVNIKAHIVETSKETARNLGIQWGGAYGRMVGDNALVLTPGGLGGSAASPTGPFSGAYTPTSVGKGISGQGFGVNLPAANMAATASASLGLLFGTIGGNILDLQLSALQKDNKLNILSSPSITTLDNQEAYTENGDDVPYIAINAVAGGGTTQTVNFAKAVLKLQITPHVIDGKNLIMKILVQKDEVDTSRAVQGNPFIIKKQTKTTLIVQDGETIVISGLSKQTNTKNVSGVPGLKDIPGLGWLFKGQGDNDQMQEVLIFITPKILPPQVVAATTGKQDKAADLGRPLN